MIQQTETRFGLNEKLFIVFFSFQSPKHTKVNQAPRVQWKRIQAGQRRDTREKNQTER